MQRVLVTGGAGTIGAAVVRRLLAEPDLAVRVCDQREPPAWMSAACEVHTADLRDIDSARAAIDGCDAVIHLAAIVGGIANFHKLPYTLSEVNAALYNAVFGAALGRDLERFVYVSSSMVFERATDFPTREEHLDVCRPFNAYGPGEMPEDEPGIAHLVPDLIRKVLSGQRPLQIFGSGRQTRTLTYVDDIADGIVTALRHPAALNQDFNISAGEELTVAGIAQAVWEACGAAPEEFELEQQPTYAVDVQRRWPSVEKASRLLGWEAQVELREGLSRTVQWLRTRTA
jgi:UDP-glucose 4-epimerase